MEHWKGFIEAAERMLDSKIAEYIAAPDHEAAQLAQEVAEGARKIKNVIKAKKLLREEMEHISGLAVERMAHPRRREQE